MRPPTIKAGQTVTFTNEDALFDAPRPRPGLALDHLVQGAV